MTSWLPWVLALVVLAGGVFLGMRSGRRQFTRHTADTRAAGFAEGEAAAEAALQARLQQTVTVVAGNDYGRTSAPQAVEPDRVRVGLRGDDGDALSALVAGLTERELVELYRHFGGVIHDGRRHRGVRDGAGQLPGGVVVRRDGTAPHHGRAPYLTDDDDDQGDDDDEWIDVDDLAWGLGEPSDDGRW